MNQINDFDWLGMQPWGNFGDGKWRLASAPGRQDSIVGAHETLSELHAAMLLDWRANYDQKRRVSE